MSRTIFIILILAAVLRVVALGYGLPMNFVGDEVSITGGALKMLELKTLIPAFYPDEFRLMYYPPVIAYIYLIFLVPVLGLMLLFGGSLADLRQSVVVDPTAVFVTTRAVTVLFGIATVYLTYLIGNRIFGKVFGMLSATFVASSFLAVQLSHFARHWMPATFFTYMVIALAFFVFFKPERKTYLWTGVIAGIAFGASYITAIGIAAFVLAHLLSPKTEKQQAEPDPVFAARLGVTKVATEKLLPDNFFKRLFDKKLWQAGFIFMIIAGVFAWLNYPEFHRIVAGEDSTLSAGKSLTGLVQAIWQSVTAFFHYEPILVLAAAGGLIVIFITHRRLFYLFSIFPLVYWLVLYFFFHFEPRYNVLLVPWFAILAALTVKQLWQINFYYILRIVAVLLVVLPFSVSGYYNFLLAQGDTRDLARTWVEENIPAHSLVYTYSKTFDLLPDRNAIRKKLTEYPYLVRTRDSVLAGITEDQYPQPSYNVLNLREMRPEDIEKILQNMNQEGKVIFIAEYDEESDLTGEVRALLDEATLLKDFSQDPPRTYLEDINGNFDENIWQIFKIKLTGPNMKIVTF